MDLATWVQILSKASHISYSTNTFEDDMNPTILHPAMSKW